MKKIIVFIILFASFTSLHAQHLRLSPAAEISVITCGPGTELYSAFGHSAFRIKDPKYRLDVVYNYGTFDYGAPYFYLKFARGKLLYELDKSYFTNFLRVYVEENRWVKEQVLNLSPKEKNSLFNYLEINAKPENSAYRYDFFFNNCATKIRDVTESALPNKIKFSNNHAEKEHTFRELIHRYINQNSWGCLGIDFCLGAVIDKNATAREFMYLPDYVYGSFKHTTFNKGQKLVKESREILTQKPLPSDKLSFFWSPIFILLLVTSIIVFITYKDYKNESRNRKLDFILFFITGLLGVFLLLLWFATDHTATALNFNLLWAFAPNIFVAFLLLKKTPPKWIKKYTLFLVILLLLAFIIWFSGIQRLPTAVLPFVLGLMIRFVFLIKKVFVHN
jgi:membrane-associated HD superfamily phosphohydrolase